MLIISKDLDLHGNIQTAESEIEAAEKPESIPDIVFFFLDTFLVKKGRN